MRLDEPELRRRVAAARSARLATVRPSGQPHLVPMVHVLDGDHLWSVVDRKPKSTRTLTRLRNIAANPQVSVLIDHYDDDWSQLWWVRLDGRARVVDNDPGHVPDLLAAKYAQYRAHPPPGPWIDIAVTSWHGWAASGSG